MPSTASLVGSTSFVAKTRAPATAVADGVVVAASRSSGAPYGDFSTTSAMTTCWFAVGKPVMVNVPRAALSSCTGMTSGLPSPSMSTCVSVERVIDSVKPPAKLSCSSMYACTAVPEGYVPAAVATSVATDFSVGATVGGLNSNFVAVMRQSAGEFVQGFGTPCSAVPPRAGAG